MVAGIDSSNDEIIDVWILNNDGGVVECSKGIGYTTCTPEQEKIVKLLHPIRHPEFISGSHANFLIQVEGKNPMNVKDFLNGYPELREMLEKLY